MLIIIEGSDPEQRASGVAGLLNLLGDVRSLTPDAEAPDWVERYVSPLLDYQPVGPHGVPVSPSHVVCDGWQLTADIDDAALDYLDRFLNTKGALVVHVWNESTTPALHEAAALSRVPVLHVREVTSSRIGQIMSVAQAFEQAAAEMYPPAAS